MKFNCSHNGFDFECEAQEHSLAGLRDYVVHVTTPSYRDHTFSFRLVLSGYQGTDRPLYSCSMVADLTEKHVHYHRFYDLVLMQKRHAANIAFELVINEICEYIKNGRH